MLRANYSKIYEETAHTCGPAIPRAGSTADPGGQLHQLTVSIIIKALNEEEHIASAIESALAALGEIDAEVILAEAVPPIAP